MAQRLVVGMIVRVEVERDAQSIQSVLQKLYVLLKAKYHQRSLALPFPSCVPPTEPACLMDFKVEIDRLCMLSFSQDYAKDEDTSSFLKAAYLIASYATGYRLQEAAKQTFMAPTSLSVAGFVMGILDKVGRTASLDPLITICQEVQLAFSDVTMVVPQKGPAMLF